MASSEVLFCPTNSPESKDIQFSDTKKSEKLELMSVLTFFAGKK